MRCGKQIIKQLSLMECDMQMEYNVNKIGTVFDDSCCSI